MVLWCYDVFNFMRHNDITTLRHTGLLKATKVKRTIKDYLRLKGGGRNSVEDIITFNKKKFRFSDWFAEKVIKAVAFLSIAIVVLIFIFVFREAFPIFKMDKTVTAKTEVLVQESYGGAESNSGNAKTTDNQVNNSNNAQSSGEKPSSTLLSNTWMPVSDNPRYGMWPLFLGTLKVTLIALLFAAPLSILAAIYTAMFAKPRVREVIKPVIELLAGFPSVVIGFFALMVMATVFQNIFGYESRLNGFVGGIAMGLAAIPIIFVTITEITANAKVKFKSAAGERKSGTSLPPFFIIKEPTPGKSPKRLETNIKIKIVATSGKYFSAASILPNVESIKPKSASNPISTAPCSFPGTNLILLLKIREKAIKSSDTIKVSNIRGIENY